MPTQKYIHKTMVSLLKYMEIVNEQKEYHHEDHVVYSCQYHVIFCPRYRRSILIPPIDERLKQLILEKQNDYGYLRWKLCLIMYIFL